MKQTITLTAAIVFTLLGLFGCKKSSDSTASYIMSASIGGTQFSASNCLESQTLTGIAITGGNGTFTTNSNPTVYPFIFLSIDNFSGVGTYTINPLTTTASGGIYYSANFSSTNPKPAVYGTIVITATSPNIVGNFSFTCLDSTKVTNGVFVAKPY